MADIFLHFRNKFARNPELISTTEPLVSKSLERTQNETKDYEKWLKTNESILLINWLREEFMTCQGGSGRTHEGIDFLVRSNSKGFRLHPALTRFSDNAFVHFFNFMKERTSKQDYKIVQSDTRIFGRGYWDETIHRHILKPKTEGGGEFSQVTISLTLKNEKLVNLIMEVNIPNTDLPRSSDDLSEWMQALLT